MAQSSTGIKRIHDDHHTLSENLDELAAAIAAMSDGDAFADLDLLATMVQYELESHIPVEERATEAALGPDHPALARLKAEHVKISAIGKRLLGLVQNVRDDVLVDREALLDAAKETVSAFRAHLEEEEKALIPLLEGR